MIDLRGSEAKQQNRESTVFIFHHPVVGVSAAPGPVETP